MGSRQFSGELGLVWYVIHHWTRGKTCSCSQAYFSCFWKLPFMFLLCHHTAHCFLSAFPCTTSLHLHWLDTGTTFPSYLLFNVDILLRQSLFAFFPTLFILHSHYLFIIGLLVILSTWLSSFLADFYFIWCTVVSFYPVDSTRTTWFFEGFKSTVSSDATGEAMWRGYGTN